MALELETSTTIEGSNFLGKGDDALAGLDGIERNVGADLEIAVAAYDVGLGRIGKFDDDSLAPSVPL